MFQTRANWLRKTLTAKKSLIQTLHLMSRMSSVIFNFCSFIPLKWARIIIIECHHRASSSVTWHCDQQYLCFAWSHQFVDSSCFVPIDFELPLCRQSRRYVLRIYQKLKLGCCRILDPHLTSSMESSKKKSAAATMIDGRKRLTWR